MTSFAMEEHSFYDYSHMISKWKFSVFCEASPDFNVVRPGEEAGSEKCGLKAK